MRLTKRSFVSFAFAAAAAAALLCSSSLDASAQSRRGGGTARLTVTRTDESLFFGVRADVSVNGTKVASLWRGESRTVTIPAGTARVAVDAFLQPGSFVVVINARPGGQYAVEVSPRGESMVPGMVFGLAGTLIEAAANKDKAGAFKMRRIR